MTSVLVGARHVGPLENSLGALESSEFTDEGVGRIDRYDVEGGINWWAESAQG